MSQFKPGMTVYIKPTNFYTVLFEHDDGRIQIQLGKGGGSFAISPEEIRQVPTLVDESEQKYWEEQGVKMRQHLKERDQKLR